ncbi:MAG: hypothetical protein OET90_01225, partial [Desulfuromonadales bacterium]|nr:hypothetical protein [Desulfuromonadales bacterium]
MNKNHKNRRTYETLTLLWSTALTFTLFATSVFQSWDKFTALMHKDFIHFILSISLALLSVVLFFAYITATHHELNLLKDYINEDDVQRIMPKTYFTIFGLALLFGAFIAVSDKLLIYSSIMVIYNLFDIWGGWQVAKKLKNPIEKKLKESCDRYQTKSLQRIKAFYFEKPTIPRVVTLMFINWIVVCMSIAHYYSGNEYFRSLGYIIIITNVLVE